MRHLPATLWCSAKHYARKQFDEPAGRVPPSYFEGVLSQYDEDVVFVHAGLSDVNGAFEGNPYEFLLGSLESQFSSILAPGFTPSFRDTGHYHRAKSPPETGTFSRLFFEDADYRTDDAIHSILVKGDYRFEDCDHHDTFSPEGCYAQLNADDVRILNVGTPWLVATQLHYVERALDVPYVDDADYGGTLHCGDGDSREIRQTNYHKTLRYLYLYFWDRLGIRRDLMGTDALDYYDVNGLRIITFTAGDLLSALRPKVEADPYYLVR